MNPSKDVRHKRLGEFGRKWGDEKINLRFKTDDILFKDFINYDVQITNPDF